MLSTETLYLSVRELGEKIRKKEISPVELTQSYLQRLEEIGPKLGAVVTVTRELALKEARAAEQEIARGRYRGALHGIPYGVKDLHATAGIPTTWGAAPYKDQVFDFDATVVEKLREAGGILVAKLAMVELAGGFGYNNADASFTGPGRSPWNTDFWSGGSSSGPGAAVAAGLVAFAIGSETSGSILTPSAYCGISGLRPTYGRVSRHGAMALCWTLDKLGPMCRSADDCGLVLEAISGRDPKDPTSLNERFEYSRRKAKPSGVAKRYKLAVVKGATDDIQPAVKKNFGSALEVISGFAELVPDVAFPDYPWSAVISTIVNAEGASAFLELIESGRARELQVPRDRIGGYSSSIVFAVDYLQAMRIRGPMKKAMKEFFSQYDAVVGPTRTTVASPINLDFDKAYPEVRGGVPLIPAGNAVGAPAISVPNGFGENHLPTAIQFMGPALGENTLIRFADAYQAATDWHRRRPSF